ncbi:MAG TPA: crosslink repair DNA glycosylase YcaQ family protein [Lacunisphaera sp.]|jgi:hypothetical protein|nr:crosslink repair DNA glycosylase YcaQ family protein [Lacunisphaera sp.]
MHLTREKVQNYIFAKHHVLPGTQCATVEECSDSLVGIHSARLPTPYFALNARVADFSPASLISSLHEKRRMLKLRCMRRTLHSVTRELAPIVHQATLDVRIRECARHFETHELSAAKLRRLFRHLEKAAAQEPLPPRTIYALAENWLRPRLKNATSAELKFLAKRSVKYAWEVGVLCYINRSKAWGAETRLYGSTLAYYPSFNLNSLSESEAIKALVRWYLEAFGPVSFDDLCWWAGISTRKLRAGLAALGRQCRKIAVDDLHDELLLLDTDWQKLQRFKCEQDEWVALLAYEDPTLKGYFETRHRYLDRAIYDDVFNQIGEVRPTIVVGGQVVGIWSWNKKTQRIVTKLLKPISRTARQKLKKIVCETEHRFSGSAELNESAKGTEPLCA